MRIQLFLPRTQPVVKKGSHRSKAFALGLGDSLKVYHPHPVLPPVRLRWEKDHMGRVTSGQEFVLLTQVWLAVP